MTFASIPGGGLSGCTVYEPTDLFDLLEGVLPEASPERTQLIDHVCSCRACQLELRAATADVTLVDFEAGSEDARLGALMDATRDAAHARLIELLRERFEARLRALDVEGRVLSEARPRRDDDLQRELDALAPRLRSRGLPGFERIADTTPDEAAARDILEHLTRLGDHEWVRLGHELLGQLLGGTASGPTDLAGRADSALGRAARLLRGRVALIGGQARQAMAHADELLAVRADDLLALGLRLAARAALGDARGFRLAASRFAGVEARHPSRWLRAWAGGRLVEWSHALGQSPRLVASWLQLHESRSAGVADVFPLVVPAAHGRAWSPGSFGDVFDDAGAGQWPDPPAE